MAEMEDRQLLREYVESRSEKAFAELVARHIDLVYAAALRLVRDAAAAQDVAQSVFILLARKAGSVREGNALPGWLYRAACSSAANHLRAELRRRERETQAMSQNDVTAEGVWDRLAPLLETGMQELSPTDQDALVLRYFEGKSLRETGQALALSEDAAQKRVSRALDKLRNHFNRHGVAVSSTVLVAAVAANAAPAAPAGLAATLAAASLAGAGGAGVAGISTAVMQTIIMAKSKTILAAALGAAALTVPILWQHSENARLRQEVAALRQENTRLNSRPPETQTVLPPALVAPRPVTNVVVKPFQWQAVESDDYRKYIANLRAIGCPEQTIRDIVVADVDKLFDERRVDIIAHSRKWQYWREEPSAQNTPDAESEAKLEELVKDKRALLKELLGTEPQSMPDLLAEAMRNTLEVAFNYLPPEKRAQALDLLMKYQDHADTAENPAGEDAATRARKLKADMELDLAKILTPEELEDWQLRSSDLSAGLRRQLTDFKPTEQEFRAIYRLQKSFETDWPRRGAPPEDPAQMPRYSAAREQFLAQVQQALGAERFGDYLKTLKR